ncbi:hypothetical protein [Streptomyces sp. NBC_01477]|uniref:hypothetical protein n=1 Tax=Streptomyces sp. NBC_01477 TaxID=2976015 RepID=UPI002E32AD65|nr:hypothetical protein [Streptomyces sp. NBC_01477]
MAPPRRGGADPVLAVMHRHRAMVAGAVDAWEIAAGLEACGVNDGEARRLRHRDVFGLAEELYARVPRAGRVAAPGEPAAGGAWLGGRTVAVHLLPGAGCVLAARFPAAAAPAAVLAAVALWAALRGGPLRIAHGAGAATWTYGLLGFALYGPQAVTALAGRGRFDTGAGTAAFAALALGLLPAAALARWFAVAARAQLGPSHGLADFADAVRPRLAAALAGHAAVQTALLLAAAVAGSAPLAGPAALGVLLFTARLLAVHGHAATAAAALAAACAAEALTLVLAAAPGHLAPPGGTAEAAACGAAALVLAARAFRLLARAAAHRPPLAGRH